MKISLNWLKDYLNLDEEPEKIAHLLTDCGLEVESLEKVETIKGGLKGIVIGEVLTCHKHPDADKLSVTTVNIGNEILPIVCGAPNVAAGQKVPVATVGTLLYNEKGESFEIKKAKIRGQESRGMICAEDELGLGTDHEGIMVLESDAQIGQPASEYFKIKEDFCIEIGLTPNRIDAASHLGVARDLLAVYKHQLPEKELIFKKPDVSKFQPDEITAEISITIQDPQACPRYTGLCISNVSIGESPDWLKNKLRVIGLKPINNVVDITNFVLHETGQPLHAFDASKIKGNQVIIKKPVKDTPFVTLDEEEVKLSGNDLMICNQDEPMCMAGILGGIDSGVTQNTSEIFLESAYFESSGIRRSSKSHTINTDSSFRFERGADPEMTLYALKRAGMLIKDIAGGKITSDVLDIYPKPVQPKQVDVKYETIHRLIGKSIPAETIKNILTSLEIEILNETEKELKLQIPLYRVDVTRPADVVEEILRIYGYNRVELPERLHASIVSTPRPDKEKLQNIASDLLSARGFNEIMNNSLTKATYYKNENLFSPAQIVSILNPLSQDLGVMRQTLFFGGMETISWNQNRRINDLKIYEFGNIYFKEETNDKKDDLKLPGYREQRMLAIFMTGQMQKENWHTHQKPVSLFDLKAEVTHLLSRMNISLEKTQMEEINDHQYWEAGLSLSLHGKILYELGEVKRSFLKSFDIKQPVFYASVNWEQVIKLQGTNPVQYSEIGKFPEVRRDLALLIGKEVKFSEIVRLAKAAEKKLLKDIRLFDIYTDKKIGENMKSYAVSFTLLDENKTLTDKEIDKVMSKISTLLQRELNAGIR
jgi:phenylalanyl-tRNA synthetase beta chain